MESVNLSKALKGKNRLLSEMKELSTEFTSSISVEVSQEFTSDTKEKLKDYENKMEEICKLKTAIQKANIEILPKIYMMAELKGYVNLLKRVKSCIKTGKFNEYTQVTEYKSNITVSEIDTMIKDAKIGINNMQDDIDEFNAKNRIEI